MTMRYDRAGTVIPDRQRVECGAVIAPTHPSEQPNVCDLSPLHSGEHFSRAHTDYLAWLDEGEGEAQFRADHPGWL